MYRYLRAVVAWVAATLSIAQHEVFRRDTSLEVYHVHVPKEASHDLAALHSIREEILGQMPDNTDHHKEIRKFFDNQEQLFQQRHGNTTSVHVEAAMLQLLTDSSIKDKTPELRSLFEYQGRQLYDIGSLFTVRPLLCASLICSLTLLNS